MPASRAVRGHEPPLTHGIKSLHSGNQDSHLTAHMFRPLPSPDFCQNITSLLSSPVVRQTVSLLSKFPFPESPLKFYKGQFWTGGKRLPVLIYHWLRKYLSPYMLVSFHYYDSKLSSNSRSLFIKACCFSSTIKVSVLPYFHAKLTIFTPRIYPK